MAKIQKIFNISFVLNKKVLILFNTMNKMNKISTFLKCTQLIIYSEVPERDEFKHFYPSLGDFCTLCNLRM